MKEKTKVNVFGEEKETWLDIKDLIDLEDALGKSSTEIFQEYLKTDLSVKDIRSAMPVVLRHAYPDANPQEILAKFDETIDSGKSSIFPFQTAIGMSIVQTGIFGRRNNQGEEEAPAAVEK